MIPTNPRVGHLSQALSHGPRRLGQVSQMSDFSVLGLGQAKSRQNNEIGELSHRPSPKGRDSGTGGEGASLFPGQRCSAPPGGAG